MALLPSIPTSFVPHPGGTPTKKTVSDIGGVLGFIAYGVLAIVFVIAIGVFIYGRLLSATSEAKAAAVTQAAAALDVKTVDEFVKLRDRLDAGARLMSSHVALSGFLTTLEAVMPSTIRFLSVRVSLDDSRTARFDAAGVAKNFNSLAVASVAFASDSRIKRAIFSNIGINKDDESVTFSLSGGIDPSVVVFTP
ncbi:MAG: hypothetical protein AAB442_00775 [Patescibacteria group bacterium]